MINGRCAVQVLGNCSLAAKAPPMVKIEKPIARKAAKAGRVP